MARFQFRLPDIGEGIAEAEIAAWHVKVGDRVAEDQTLVDIMTDKATVDMTSPVDGVVAAVHGQVGDMAPVGSVLVELEVADQEPRVHQVVAPEPAMQSFALDGEGDGETTSVRPSARNTPLAAPATRRRAKEAGIALDEVTGTGPGGRILRQDLEAHIAASGKTAPAASHPARDADTFQEEKIVGLRRRIAERMELAARIPQISYVEEVDVTALEALRQDMNDHRAEGEPKLTLLPFLVRALVRTLPDFPRMNARFDAEAGILKRSAAVHVGIATHTDQGLMVPVLRNAQALSLHDCAREIFRLAAAARNGTAARDELSGSTITITSLGPLAGVVATPMLNAPEVAIIGPNRIVERALVRDGLLCVRKMMNISSSFDHRIVDGHDAAMFIARIKRMLEQPALMFMEA